MIRKLQHNLDIIQYLVKDASPEQWTWRSAAVGWSLGEIICHLRDKEVGHAGVQIPEIETPDLSTQSYDARAEKASITDDPAVYFSRAFETFADYRRRTEAVLQKYDFTQDQQRIAHKQFGSITPLELVEKIDAHDQSHIHQMEEIIQAMPLNPLRARAVYEIDKYYRRYRPYLAQAASLLDIGVGPGLALKYVMLQHPDLTFDGVDVRDLRLPDIAVPLKIYDGHTLPFLAKQFDVSLLFYVLHHCHNPQRVLAETIRVTRQKLIIIEEFDHPDADETSLDLTERQSHQALGLPTDLPYQLFDKPEFEAMLKAYDLLELNKQVLPSKTTRPVQKYLYVMAVKRGV